MKKQLAAAVSVLLLAGLAAVPTFAAGGVYTFEEYGFQCRVPDALYVFTQDMDENDPLFEKFDVTYEEEMDYLTSNGFNTILSMNDALLTFGLDLDVYEETSFDDFADYAPEDLDALAESYANLVYSTEGTEVQDIYTQEYNGVPYVFVFYSVVVDDLTYYSLDCQTVVNGLNYCYTLYSYLESVTSAQLGYLESILNSSTFSTPGEPITGVPAEASTVDITSAATDAASSPSLMFSIVVGLIAGLLVGLLPLIVGLKKKQKALAWVGFGVCGVCGGILGLILALPAAVIFLIVILVRGKKKPNAPGDGYYQEGYGQAPNGPTGQEPWNLPPQNEVNITPKDDPWDS